MNSFHSDSSILLHIRYGNNIKFHKTQRTQDLITMERQILVNPLIMDIHNLIMHIHISIMDIDN